MAKKLVCPHCGQEVEPGNLECPFCHESMFLSMNQIKAKEQQNYDKNRVVTQEQYIREQQEKYEKMQQEMQYQNNLNPSAQPQQQTPIQQPVMQQQMLYNPATGEQIPAYYDPNTGQMVQMYYDPNTGNIVQPNGQPVVQSNGKPINNNQGESKTVLYIALVLDIFAILLGGSLVLALIALALSSAYKGECGLKTATKGIASGIIIVFVVVLVIAFMG